MSGLTENMRKRQKVAKKLARKGDVGLGEGREGTEVHVLLYTLSACLRQGLAFLAQNFELMDPPPSVSGVLEV